MSLRAITSSPSGCRVRSRLSAGANRIRTIGPSLELSRVEDGSNRRENLMGARPLLSLAEVGADLGNRGYRRDSHQCSDQRIFDCGETGTMIDEIL